MTSIKGSDVNSADINDGWDANVTISNSGNAGCSCLFRVR